MSNLELIHDRQNTESTRYLPTELLLTIVDLVESDEDLLALATASRRFHNLSLHRYFSKHDFDPYSKELRLSSIYGSLNNLAGLAIFLDLVGASVEHLSYDFQVGYTEVQQLVKEVRLLTQYVAKLSSINRVSLRLASFASGDPKESREANILLLTTILARSCRDIRITASQLTSFDDAGPKHMPPSSKPADWLKNYWPGQRPPPTNGSKHLKSCFVHTFPRFLRPFYFHMLRTNASVLTDLAFRNIFGGGTDWATMLAHLHFPHLRRLTIIYGVIPRDPLIKFLTKHPGTLTAFQYHHIRYEPPPKHPVRTSVLGPVFHDRLETLTTSSEHILNFLPPFSCMPKLKNVVIQVEELLNNFIPLEGALQRLAACVNKITLTLEVTRTGLGFGVWFSNIFRGNLLNAATRPESLLRCVETLVMDNGDWGFMDNHILARLPRWLGLFPELRALTLRGGGPGHKQLSPFDDHSLSASALIKTLREACPGLYVEFCARESVNV
ncbi:hypothetical protein BDZ97DRAFT_1835760 [Flammula alnicola]|nr:hypothetical protein BDZ97DRAFT_1835760 [Flammula alnicola]